MRDAPCAALSSQKGRRLVDPAEELDDAARDDVDGSRRLDHLEVALDVRPLDGPDDAAGHLHAGLDLRGAGPLDDDLGAVQPHDRDDGRLEVLGRLDARDPTGLAGLVDEAVDEEGAERLQTADDSHRNLQCHNTKAP